MNSLVLRVFKGVSPLHFKKMFTEPTLKASYHSSLFVEKGRLTGSKALEPKPRKPSKKQRQRAKAAAVLRSEQQKSDPRKLKINKEKESYIKKQTKSPEIQNLIKNTESNIDRIFNELQLPDTIDAADYKSNRNLPPVDVRAHIAHLQSIKLLKSNIDTPLNIKSLSWVERAEIMVKSDGTQLDLEEVRSLDEDSNRAITELLTATDKQVFKRYANAKLISKEMYTRGIPLSEENQVKLISFAIQINELPDANSLFNTIVRQVGIDKLSDDMWALRIDTLVALDQLDQAAELFEERLKIKESTECVVYTALLNGLVKNKKYDQIQALWMRMHDNGLTFSVEAFNAMIKKCLYKGEPERAFFLYDEMRVQGIAPNEKILATLIDAAGTAPHYVNGYQNTIFDALYVAEGAEIIPNDEIYNAIIRSFGKTGDSVAAEYYFWEMRRKGILPTAFTYDALLEAYARAITVGAPRYGMNGRFVKPKPRELSQEEEAYLTLGPVKVAKLMSQNFYADVETEKGKRAKATVKNMFDDPEAGDEEYSIITEMIGEAKYLRDQAAAQELKRNELKLKRLAAATASESVELEQKNAPLSLESPQKQFSFDAVLTHADEKENVVDEELANEDPDLRRLLEIMKKESPPKKVPIVAVKENNDKLVGATVDEKRSALLALDGEVSDDEDSEEEEDSDSEKEEEIYKDEKTYGKVNNTTAQLLHTRFLMKESKTFTDPFAHVNTIKGRLSADYKAGLISKMHDGTPLVQAEKTELLKMLDGTGNEITTLEQRRTPPAGSNISQEYVDYLWDMVEYGRAPDPNYEVTLSERRAQNTTRAKLAFQELIADGIKPNANVLSKLLLAFCNQGDKEGAAEVYALFDKYGLTPNVHTYRAMTKLCIEINDINQALELKTEMLKTLKPDAKMFGMIIESLSHRGMIVEALQLLEESSEHKITIPVRNLMNLRGRCEGLGVYHPDLGTDPKGWVKDLKHVRKQKTLSSKRGIQQVRSTLF